MNNEQRAAFERMIVTQPVGGGTALAKDRLRKLAGHIACELRIYDADPVIARLLEEACFDTFREGIILADQSVVEQLAIAIATIEEIQQELRGCQHERCLTEAALQRGVTDCSTPMFIMARTVVEELEKTERKVEDLANDRAAADADAAKQREEIHVSRKVWAGELLVERNESEQLRQQLAEANRNIKALNEEVEHLRRSRGEARYELNLHAERIADAQRVLRGEA